MSGDNSRSRIFFKPKRSLGQNFLFDEKILDRIATACSVDQDSKLIEIGPGYGSLTRLLSKASRSEVFAIEKDESLFNWLTLNLANERINFTLADALEVDWESFIASKELTGSEDLIVVGNLPYNISNQLLINLLENNHLFKRMIFLVQKEVGQRWVASPTSYKSNYSNLSIFVEYFCKSTLLFEIPKESFKPVPAVDGALIQLEVRKDLPTTFQRRKFFTFVRNCFRFRRKTLYNNIKSFSVNQQKTKLAFEKFGYQEKVRPQDLSLKDYIALFEELANEDKK